MNALTPAIPTRPVVIIDNGEPLADSRDVASFFGRQHKHVLESYRNAKCSDEFRVSNFRPFVINDLQGTSLSHVMMTQKGFAFLCLAFTGERAARFREDYIEEFDRMASELRRRNAAAAPAIDPLDLLKDPSTVLALIAHHAEKRLVAETRAERAEAEVQAARPAVEFCEALADSDGTWGLQDAGKALHQPPNKFVAWLKGRHDLFERNGGNVAKQDLIDRGFFTVVWRDYGGKPRPVTRLTGRGIVHYAKLLGVRPPQQPPQALLPGI